MSLISGNANVCRNLAKALEAGKKVTAKVRWLPNTKNIRDLCWIHCTPLMGPGNVVRVWTAVLVNAERHQARQHAQDSFSRSQRGYRATVRPSGSVKVASDSGSDTTHSLGSHREITPNASKARNGEMGKQMSPEIRPSAAQRLLASNAARDISDSDRGGKPYEDNADSIVSIESPLALGQLDLNSEYAKSSQTNASDHQWERESIKSRPGKRSYKSLSPYGILF